MNTENPNKYEITYSNYLEFEGRLLAFRKHLLFDISTLPKLIPYNENSDAWIVNRKQLSKLKAKQLIVMKDKKVDVSELQWYEQIKLDECFNLN
jgi:hypothetical protein